MDIFSTYSIKIKHYNHIFKETVTLYRKAVDFFIDVCLKEWDSLSDLTDNQKKKCYLGGLDNCYYLLEAPPKEPNPCEDCEFGRQRPCVGICYRMLRIQQKGVRAWRAVVSSRTLGGRGCPYCSGSKVLLGFNDLVTTDPGLLPEWNYERNDSLKPSEITARSGKKVWWKCSKGHEWRMAVNTRTGPQKAGCPYCSNRMAWEGYNDLLTVSPSLAAEWDIEKNDGLRPSEVTYRTMKHYWWKCDKGHSWKESVYQRQKGTGCPYCSGRFVSRKHIVP